MQDTTMAVTVCEIFSGASAREARQRSTMGKKNWLPIKRRKFGYDVSVRASVHPYGLRGRGRGVSRYSSRSPIRETKECHLSLAVFCLEKSEKHSYIFAMSTNDRRGWSNVPRSGFTEAERERERQRARINRQRCGEEVRERVGHG